MLNGARPQARAEIGAGKGGNHLQGQKNFRWLGHLGSFEERCDGLSGWFSKWDAQKRLIGVRSIFTAETAACTLPAVAIWGTIL